MIIGYARVSTSNNQNDSLDKQIQILMENGVDYKNIYKEKVTGTSTAQRTELNNMIQYARSGDLILCTKIDRLARSIMDLNKIVKELNNNNISIKFIKDNLTFEAGNNNSMNTLMFNILGSFAQFERDLIVERTTEGRERAKQQGKHMGRKGSSTIKEINKAIELYNKREENKLSVSDILKMTGVKRSTFYYELKKVR
ncbi:recombinase family protein [Macrococcus hajekii]|uniref:Recombinase family protein n=1 Tax=Macrococcus hajekii TaxID=198482 RepID=A0A4V3BE90_9STAP|nr:recombinase family protein [Macrococcus hajekii]TDM03155.1 recombinase family protein [Macrococcus hajekii]GGA96410.1 resolvase [Macrococcus hajekii]